MKRKLAHFLAVPILLGTMCFGLIQNVSAAYGTGTYGACTYQYQTDCTAAAATSSSSSATGAPDTGLEPVSLLWPAIVGIIGLCLVSFVAIRYIHRDRDSKA